MKVEVNVEGGVVTDARVSGTMARGTTNLPEIARVLRNLSAGACWLHDHPLHFYHLSALDYLDLSVLSNYSGSDTYLNKIKNLVVAELNNPINVGRIIRSFDPCIACAVHLITPGGDIKKFVINQ